MSYPHRAVVAVDTSHDLSILKPIHRMDFLTNSEIHLVHVVQEIDYTDGLSFSVSIPLIEDMADFKLAVINKMKSVSDDILPYGFQGKVIYSCLFAYDPCLSFCRYLDEVKADLAVVVTREKRGLFESSFARNLGKHASCNVLVHKA